MTAEAKNATRILPQGLWLGMTVVAVVYVLRECRLSARSRRRWACRNDGPVSAVLHEVAGPVGARLTSLAIALSTLGFMSSRMLSAPRLYQAMSDDGLFFRAFGRLNPRTRVPTLAIVLQGAVAIVIAMSGDFDHIVNYVVSALYLFNGFVSAGAVRHCALGIKIPATPANEDFACRAIRLPPESTS